MPSPSLTTYLSTGLLNHVLRNTAYTPAASVFVALFSADPGEAGALTNEVTGTAYARQLVLFNAPTTNAIANTDELIFPQAGASWGTITHVGLMNAVSGGNMLWVGALSTSKTIAQNDQFRIAAGALICTLD